MLDALSQTSRKSFEKVLVSPLASHRTEAVVSVSFKTMPAPSESFVRWVTYE